MIVGNMPIPKERICDCLRCGHAWVKRIPGVPVRCPECKSPYWHIKAGKLPMGRPWPKKKAGKKKGQGN